jgi:hypothetical protein
VGVASGESELDSELLTLSIVDSMPLLITLVVGSDSEDDWEVASNDPEVDSELLALSVFDVVSLKSALVVSDSEEL